MKFELVINLKTAKRIGCYDSTGLAPGAGGPEEPLDEMGGKFTPQARKWEKVHVRVILVWLFDSHPFGYRFWPMRSRRSSPSYLFLSREGVLLLYGTVEDHEPEQDYD